MKYLSVIILCMLFATGYSQEMSDYEKYRIEQERILYPDEVEPVFEIVEDMPKFKGQEAKLFRVWIAEHVIYPKEAVQANIQGKVIVSFVVNSDGNVVNVKIEKGVNEYLDVEAMRVVTSSPKWKPGKQEGETVNVKFTFPINFVLSGETAAQDGNTVINNYYDYNSGFMNALYFGVGYSYSFYNPCYYSAYYPYYRYSYYPYYRYRPYYGHNHYTGRRYSTSHALGSHRNYYSSKFNTYNSGAVNRPSASNVLPPKTSRVTNRQPANVSRASAYKPAQFNRPVTRTTTSVQKITTVRSNRTKPATYSRQPTQRSNTSSYSRPATTQRSSASYNRSSTSQRSNSSYNRNSQPTRSSASYSRSSSPSRK